MNDYISPKTKLLKRRIAIIRNLCYSILGTLFLFIGVVDNSAFIAVGLVICLIGAINTFEVWVDDGEFD